MGRTSGGVAAGLRLDAAAVLGEAWIRDAVSRRADRPACAGEPASAAVVRVDGLVNATPAAVAEATVAGTLWGAVARRSARGVGHAAAVVCEALIHDARC